MSVFPAGANTDGVCGLSPCLVVQLVPSLDSVTIYLNCMTAAVELVGIGPGTLVQLEGMSVNLSGRCNRYISASPDSSITALSWGEAKHVCKTRLGGKWPFPGGPCNGLAYGAPSAWHCCIVDKIEVTLSPACDRCGRRKTCAPSCRPLGSVPRATATARFRANSWGQCVAVCHGDQVRKLLRLPESLWTPLLQKVFRSGEPCHFGSKKNPAGTLAHRPVPKRLLEEALDKWCKRPALVRCVGLACTEYRTRGFTKRQSQTASAELKPQRHLQVSNIQEANPGLVKLQLSRCQSYGSDKNQSS